MLTPAGTLHLQEGVCLVFRLLKVAPRGSPVAPGLEEAGVLGGIPGSGFIKGRERAGSPFPEAASRSQRGGTTALGTQLGHPKNAPAPRHPSSPPTPFLGVPPQQRVLPPSPTCPAEGVFAWQHPCPWAGH